MFKKLISQSINFDRQLNPFSTSSIKFNKKKVGFIGAPFSDGQPKRGTELGPRYYILNHYNVHNYNLSLIEDLN